MSPSVTSFGLVRLLAEPELVILSAGLIRGPTSDHIRMTAEIRAVPGMRAGLDVCPARFCAARDRALAPYSGLFESLISIMHSS